MKTRQRNASRIIYLGFILIIGLVTSGIADKNAVQFLSFLDIPYASIEGSPSRFTSLDIHVPTGQEQCPVILFLHGGTWIQGDKKGGNSKIHIFIDAGWILVSVNYRLSPNVKHPAHVRDVAKAIVWVYHNISRYHGDPEQIFLLGHSAGAHLAALVTLDHQYLQVFGEDTGIIQGVIGLDSGAYYLPALFRSEPENFMFFTLAFGKDSDIWEEASPIMHVADAKKIPPFLLIYAGDRQISREATLNLAQKLHRKNVPVHLYHAADKDHVSVERSIGQPGDKTTEIILQFIKQYRQ